MYIFEAVEPVEGEKKCRITYGSVTGHSPG